MKQKYYIYNDNAPEGPFSIEELKAREITKYTPIWQEGLKDWTPAGKIDALEPLWSYQPYSPFVHYPEAPPEFNRDGYEEKLERDKNPPVTPLYKNALVWIAAFGLVLITLGWLVYNRSTRIANEQALAAVAEDEKRWDDSVNKRARDEQNAAIVTASDSNDNAEFYADRTENAKNYARMNIERLVRSTKSFDRKRFGGIENAQVTFFNGSDFPIDRAEFRVQYIKPNGDVFEETSVVIDDVKPHRSKTKNITDSKRGVNMRAQLTKIVSTELGLVKNVSVGF